MSAGSPLLAETLVVTAPLCLATANLIVPEISDTMTTLHTREEALLASKTAEVASIETAIPPEEITLTEEDLTLMRIEEVSARDLGQARAIEEDLTSREELAPPRETPTKGSETTVLPESSPTDSTETDLEEVTEVAAT